MSAGNYRIIYEIDDGMLCAGFRWNTLERSYSALTFYVTSRTSEYEFDHVSVCSRSTGSHVS